MATNKPLKEGQVSISVFGKTGKVDGYMEMIIGTLFVSDILLSPPVYQKITGDDGNTQLIAHVLLKTPPLGHMGEGDYSEVTK